ncbi:MAG: HAD family hydrolase [Anaerolineae bacterium]|nr:MAG: HAD family hydrolase [Anaerolineae bacterium]
MSLDIARVQALFFDVDGTLSDTDDLYVRRLRHWLSPLERLLPSFDAQRVARALVMRAETPGNAVYALADALGLDDLAYRMFSRLPHREAKPHFLLIPGVRAMLERTARRYPLAVISARGELSTRQFLAQYDLEGFFQEIVTAHTCKRTKPSPEPVLWAAARMGIPAECCVMIGDTTVDIRAGKAAGAQTIGVLCGFGERDELSRTGVDLILESTAEVADVFGC